MSLSGSDIVTVSEIAQETYDDVAILAVSLTTDQENSILDDLDTWGTIRDSHVRLKGGKDGVDFDNERKREGIRQRIRKMLGLPLYSPESPNALQLVELEVGSNFA